MPISDEMGFAVMIVGELAAIAGARPDQRMFASQYSYSLSMACPI